MKLRTKKKNYMGLQAHLIISPKLLKRFSHMQYYGKQLDNLLIIENGGCINIFLYIYFRKGSIRELDSTEVD